MGGKEENVQVGRLGAGLGNSVTGQVPLFLGMTRGNALHILALSYWCYRLMPE